MYLTQDPQAVLAAMITPAVLISACGSLILATSERLNRAVTRAREVSAHLVAIAETPDSAEVMENERRMLFTQLDFVTTRSRLLQRALSRLYGAVGVFVGTSVSIGVVAATDASFAVLPILLGLLGGALLLYASTLLIKESRFALTALNAEMDFVWTRGKQLGPEDLVRKGPARSRMFGKPR